MKKIVDIFRCGRKDGAYLYLLKGQSQKQLPELLLKQCGNLELAMSLVLTPEKKLARANAKKVLQSLDEKGYYLQLPPVPEPYMQAIPNDKLTVQPI